MSHRLKLSSFLSLLVVLITSSCISNANKPTASAKPGEPEAPPLRISSADPNAPSNQPPNAAAEAKPEVKGDLVPPAEDVAANPDDKPSPFGGAAGKAKQVRIAAGTYVGVRLRQPLAPASLKAGDKFHAVLDQPIWAGGRIIAEKGSKVHGVITEAKHDGDRQVSVSLTSLETDLGSAVIHTGDFVFRPRTRGGESVVPADTRAGFKLQSAVNLN